MRIFAALFGLILPIASVFGQYELLHIETTPGTPITCAASNSVSLSSWGWPIANRESKLGLQVTIQMEGTATDVVKLKYQGGKILGKIDSIAKVLTIVPNGSTAMTTNFVIDVSHVEQLRNWVLDNGTNDVAITNFVGIMAVKRFPRDVRGKDY